jgi:ubiquinone/menaquinone biosynthesis C-methylase UbiE
MWAPVYNALVTTASDDVNHRRASVFFQIHKDLPREGPGDTASTHRAYRFVGERLAPGRILDVGCGPGAQTLDLANVTAASITALDIHRPYLDQLCDRVRVAGLSRRVHAVQASMFSLPFLDERFDVIWAEGAIYIAGFERGLEEWRRLLRPGGYVAATHLSWLTPDIPDEPRAFWNRNYPAIRAVEENARIATQCGFELLECFTLPQSAWWNEYYGPMESRLLSLRDHYRGNDEALAVIESSGEQIDLYRRFARYYGYVFYVLRMR